MKSTPWDEIILVDGETETRVRPTAIRVCEGQEDQLHLEFLGTIVTVTGDEMGDDEVARVVNEAPSQRSPVIGYLVVTNFFRYCPPGTYEEQKYQIGGFFDTFLYAYFGALLV